jgi:hypothetical protein
VDYFYAAIPEVHISFFEPSTLYLALKKSGFKPEFRGFLPGFSEIMKFKILKNLRCRYASTLFDIFPWTLISKMVDKKFKLSAHPIGIAI